MTGFSCKEKCCNLFEIKSVPGSECEHALEFGKLSTWRTQYIIKICL